MRSERFAAIGAGRHATVPLGQAGQSGLRRRLRFAYRAPAWRGARLMWIALGAARAAILAVWGLLKDDGGYLEEMDEFELRQPGGAGAG